MGNSSKALKLVLATGLAAGLAGCGGNAPSRTTTDGTNNPDIVTGPNTAKTIVITLAVPAAIEDLGGGLYRREGKVIVTDIEGNAVADGTRITLKAIDSIKATGVISSADNDSISGTTITDLPMLTNGTSSGFSQQAYVHRDNSFYFIEAGDHVLLSNSAENDQVRVVGPAPTTQTELSVSYAFSENYPNPNSVYDTSYKIGASLLGVEISGATGATGVTSTQGGAGVAVFYITYPATPDTLTAGCPGSALTFDPAGSVEPYIIAYTSDSVASFQDFCFEPIP